MSPPVLSGLRVCVDVQHLYRTDKPRDRGTIFELPNGLHIAEGALSTVYAAAIVAKLREWSASVLTNDPRHNILIGTYFERNRAASAWGANCYLACHVNAGHGSYARAEYLAESHEATHNLAAWAVRWLHPAFPTMISAGVPEALNHGDRGRICVEGGVPDMAAIIVEPFFGDRQSQAPLTSTPNLVAIGNAIALGVADWWLHYS